MRLDDSAETIATLRAQLDEWREKAHFHADDADHLRAHLATRDEALTQEQYFRDECEERCATLRAQLAEAQTLISHLRPQLALAREDTCKARDLARQLADSITHCGSHSDRQDAAMTAYDTARTTWTP